MKKIRLFFIPLFSLSANINADIIDKIIERHSFLDWQLPFSLIVHDHNEEFVVFYEGSGYLPTIVGYQFNRDNLKFIVKQTYYGQEEDVPGEVYKSIYYLIEIKENNSEIECNYHEIDRLNLNSFVVNKAMVNDNNVNTRSVPSLSGEKYLKLNRGNMFNILLVSNYMEIDKMYDYWYKIEVNNREVWIYGYFVWFSRAVKLIDIRQNISDTRGWFIYKF